MLNFQHKNTAMTIFNNEELHWTIQGQTWVL